MKFYNLTIHYKKTNKVYKEIKQLSGSVDYWRKVIKTDDIRSNLVSAYFEYDILEKQIVLTRYELNSLEKIETYSLIEDVHQINGLNQYFKQKSKTKN